MLIESIQINKELFPLIKHLSQGAINQFGVTTGATGRIHLDPEYCKNTPFKKTLAHGFLSMGYVAEMMENNFGSQWLESGELDVKYVGLAHPGDSLICSGFIDQIKEQKEDLFVTCKVEVRNKNGIAILVGSAALNIEK
jgi:3-hydroxybutyryl-CoA dehydratase